MNHHTIYYVVLSYYVSNLLNFVVKLHEIRNKRPELTPTRFTVHPGKSRGTQTLRRFWRQGMASSIVWT